MESTPIPTPPSLPLAVDGNGSKDNPFFSLDGNGTLSSTVIFGLRAECIELFHSFVTDEHNASFEKAFAISLLNEIEDLDGGD